MTPWFFLSYARANPDTYVQRFYRDLNDEIRRLTAPGEGTDGFLDEQSIEVGKPWRDELTAALQTCRAFIALYTPAYFTSEECGKEWQIFNSRQAAHSSQLNAAPPSLIIPVLWIPEARLPGRLPDAVSALQYKHSDFGEVYAREGLRRLIANSKYRNSHYRTFVARLAEKLIEAATARPLPPHTHLPPVSEIKSAFHQYSAEGRKATEEPVNMGARFVQFIFVAGRRDELQVVRKKLDPYGEKGGRDWHPYLPDVKEEVGIIAQRITADEQFHYEPVHLSDDLINRIEEADRQNNIVAIVVDTWTLRLPRYSTFMRKYDDRRFLNCVVLVSWNNRDDETEIKRSLLISEMESIFLNNCIQRDPNCFLEISSHDELKRELPAALHKALHRIARKVDVVKRAEGAQAISKPMITGVRRMSA